MLDIHIKVQIMRSVYVQVTPVSSGIKHFFNSKLFMMSERERISLIWSSQAPSFTHLLFKPVCRERWSKIQNKIQAEMLALQCVGSPPTSVHTASLHHVYALQGVIQVISEDDLTIGSMTLT